ncbi:exo-beta-N-acetylmuramidase NamZ domain-containing protein [Prevotella sp. 10(H)]|uniref:exo-beta-N-acetylmuramidase NamZ family protein n=1 Tax=Prevotella sp. 10(H) TaxID=1158294 RepID=UPI0004A764EE|nr:DUF1343 domain-containing protein [Prevotella sp. 10(H)]
MKMFYILLVVLLSFIPNIRIFAQTLSLGADRLDVLLPELKGKKIALIVNQTSVLSDGTHLLDALLANKVNIIKIFAPEHGFKGTADAGETIADEKEKKTQIPVISLYGKNYKPLPSQVEDADILLFDIQDVGTRFYTYISTMHYVMEACAENGKECIILDRPNPNDQIDGPVLNPKYKSFIGMHPIPVLHGLTIGELAQMINGEGWLKGGKKCNLKVIAMTGWKHGDHYIIPIKPSPNLPNAQSVSLYPSLCFFEATKISIGRGTDFPFQVIGGTSRKYGDFTFVPRPNEGNKTPLNMGKTCYGVDLRYYEHEKGIDLNFLLSFYKKSALGSAFFSSPKFMDLLAGTNTLRLQITKGLNADNIRKSWEKDLNKYRTIRQKYLLYAEN